MDGWKTPEEIHPCKGKNSKRSGVIKNYSATTVAFCPSNSITAPGYNLLRLRNS